MEVFGTVRIKTQRYIVLLKRLIEIFFFHEHISQVEVDFGVLFQVMGF